MSIAGFAECAVSRDDVEGPAKTLRRNVPSNFELGIYMGFGRASCAHRCVTIGDGGSTHTSRHVMRKPEPDR